MNGYGWVKVRRVNVSGLSLISMVVGGYCKIFFPFSFRCHFLKVIFSFSTHINICSVLYYFKIEILRKSLPVVVGSYRWIMPTSNNVAHTSNDE